MGVVWQQHQHICLILAGLTLFISSQFLQHAAAGDEGICYGSTSWPCTAIRSNITYPFLTTSSCGDIPNANPNSKLIITGCDTPNATLWRGFADASPGAIKLPIVRGFSGPSPGLINLTWNMDLTKQPRCSPLAVKDMSNYLPQTVNLTSFLQSFLSFSPWNIFLLFGCNETLAHSNDTLEKNTSACTSYAKGCPQNSLTCFQYRPRYNKELTMQQDTDRAQCKMFLFFISTSPTENITKFDLWRPGLIQLNWTDAIDGDSWLASLHTNCSTCLERNGTCSSDKENLLQCLCNTTVCGETLRRSSKRGLIIALVAGICGTMALVGVALFYFWHRRKANAINNNEPCRDKLWNKKPSFLTRKQDAIATEEFTYLELLEATDSFAGARMLGDGGFGAVYMGSLADHRKVAVKKLYHDNVRSMEHFANEIKTLSRLNHPNLVKLYGFCWESERDVLLVFEYASNGTVFDHLHNPSKPAMPWKLRLNIACETANALCYLHNSVCPPIYHRDVKTTNILLDEEYHAKLADFGLSKLVPPHLTHISTAPQGTPGYLDPEYHECYQLTDKSDVYSLGVVLVELVSGKLAVDFSRGKGEINLYTLAVVKIKSGLWEELVDPKLKMKKNSVTEKMVKEMIELAFECLQVERDNRPAMSIVAESLDRTRRNFAHVDEDDGDTQSTTN